MLTIACNAIITVLDISFAISSFINQSDFTINLRILYDLSYVMLCQMYLLKQNSHEEYTIANEQL